MNTRLSLTLLLAMASAPAVSVERHPQSPSLCTSTEQTVFACMVGKKLLSICGSKELTPTVGYLQYRFGRSIDNLELEFPQEKTHPTQWFRFASPFSGAKSSLNKLQFQHSNYRYTVSAFTSAFSDAGFGVEVVAPDGKSSYLQCATIPVVNEKMNILQRLNLPPISTDGNHATHHSSSTR